MIACVPITSCAAPDAPASSAARFSFAFKLPASHATVTPKGLDRKVHIADRYATVDGMYLRIIVHANEHMGQLIAYGRMTGVTPPWSKKD